MPLLREERIQDHRSREDQGEQVDVHEDTAVEGCVLTGSQQGQGAYDEPDGAQAEHDLRGPGHQHPEEGQQATGRSRAAGPGEGEPRQPGPAEERYQRGVASPFVALGVQAHQQPEMGHLPDEEDEG